MKYRIVSLLLLIVIANAASFAQSTYGTTGLLQMPTADMQKDKTIMVGGNAINHHVLSKYWASRREYNPYTFNYYVNVTLFPWLEIAYSCTLVKGLYNSTYWPKNTWGKFVNQDRAFHGKLRLWKEGWWKSWTPQIVIGANDPVTHSSDGGGDIDLGGGSGNHNYLTRFFVAATKHLEFKNWGTLGVHAAYIVGNAMTDAHYNRPAVGANFRLGLPSDNKYMDLLNGIDIMAEICPGHDESVTKAQYNANVGVSFSAIHDLVNVQTELINGKYFNAGLYFRVVLK